MKLNDKQKNFLFDTIFGNNLQEIYKVFDTISISYLKKQKIVFGKAEKGWVPLIMNGEELTLLNFDVWGERGWNKIWGLA